jgi:acetyl-CoA acetyltransferase
MTRTYHIDEGRHAQQAAHNMRRICMHAAACIVQNRCCSPDWLGNNTARLTYVLIIIPSTPSKLKDQNCATAAAAAAAAAAAVASHCIAAGTALRL